MKRITVVLVGLLLAGWLAGGFALNAQSPRGQGVRIRVGNNQELDLYDESHALVVGVSDYTQGWRDLPGVQRDVVAVKAVLAQQGFQVETLLNPTHAQLDDALRSFISNYGLRERNRLLVYFAGHGHTEALPDGRDLGYIVPADAPLPERNPQLFNRRAISMDDIQANALRIQSKHALFVFDSCFSGSIFEMRSDRAVPPGIESKTAAPVRQFITSGTKNQSVPDDSIFRRYFERAFAQREGDLNGDGFITGEELGMYLAGRVASDSRDTQTPRYGKIRDAKLNLGDFVFALPKKEAVVTAPTQPAGEQAMWELIKDSNEAAEFEDYLKSYPNGEYANAARVRLRRLQAIAARPPVSAPASPVAAEPAPAPAVSVAGVPLTTFSFTTANVDDNGNVINRRQEQAWGFMQDLGGGVTGVKLEMVEVPGGEFLMGSPDDEKDRSPAEGPQHRVTVPGFAIGKYEVTQAQWRAVAKLPKVVIELEFGQANFTGDTLPMERVSWEEVVEFCQRLERKTGRAYRLPTEAEWEYAARAETTTPFAFGPTITPAIVNYNGNYPYSSSSKGEYRRKSIAVGTLGVANAFGLFDLHGNVFEWCEDYWHDNYSGAPSDGSAWLSGDGLRVLRGGSWYHSGWYCRAAYRIRSYPGERYDYYGFRVVVSARTRP